MKYALVVKAEVIQDLSEAFEWYERQRSGLGSEFLDEVEKYFELITRSPEQYQSHANQHIAVMYRFPYKIVYEIVQQIIVVYAVYHDKRGPEKLATRE